MFGQRSLNWSRLAVEVVPRPQLQRRPLPRQLRAEDKLLDETRPIIVIKKKAGHAAHHGGAWKVAYADFVTAMMALFIVLWLLSSSEQVKKAVGGYFSDPSGSGKQMGTSMAGMGESISVSNDDTEQLKS